MLCLCLSASSFCFDRASIVGFWCWGVKFIFSVSVFKREANNQS